MLRIDQIRDFQMRDFSSRASSTPSGI